MDRQRLVLWHGTALFLLGLLTGLIEQNFLNPRMGLAAHLEGVMNGILLLSLGAAWAEVRLSRLAKAAAYWALICGTYGNWAVTTLAAVLGTAAMSPITAAGHGAETWKEATVTAGFVLVGLLMIGATGLLLWGFRRSVGKLQPA